jgi:hypothetical protein
MFAKQFFRVVCQEVFQVEIVQRSFQNGLFLKMPHCTTVYTGTGTYGDNKVMDREIVLLFDGTGDTQEKT